jgi:hypothetical protein
LIAPERLLPGGAEIHDGQEQSERSTDRPDTLMQDPTSPLRGFPLQHTAGPYIRNPKAVFSDEAANNPALDPHAVISARRSTGGRADSRQSRLATY